VLIARHHRDHPAGEGDHHPTGQAGNGDPARELGDSDPAADLAARLRAAVVLLPPALGGARS
jgi:hypothetical protein